MAKKGVEKNTRNKAKHTKLLKKKKEKLRLEKEVHKLKIKAIQDRAKEQKEGNPINQGSKLKNDLFPELHMIDKKQ